MDDVGVALDLDLDGELLGGVKGGLVGKGHEADFVKGIRSVGNQFTEENVLKSTLVQVYKCNYVLRISPTGRNYDKNVPKVYLILVEGVDDELHHAVDLGLELHLLGALAELGHFVLGETV